MSVNIDTVNTGDQVVLAEEHGYAAVTILSKTVKPGWVDLRIRFDKILVQYPYVPYNPGDEIEIGCPTGRPSGYGWYFEDMQQWQSFRAPELRA